MVIRIGSFEILIGSFIASVVNFLIAAFIIFSMVKLINGIHERAAMRKKTGSLKKKIKSTSLQKRSFWLRFRKKSKRGINRAL